MSADIYLHAAGCCDAHNHNVTHNLGPMFRAAGLDWHDYRAEPRAAWELLANAVVARNEMLTDPERFRALNPPNGWGDYVVAVSFLEHLITDCAKHPEATVEVSL